MTKEREVFAHVAETLARERDEIRALAKKPWHCAVDLHVSKDLFVDQAPTTYREAGIPCTEYVVYATERVTLRQHVDATTPQEALDDMKRGECDWKSETEAVFNYEVQDAITGEVLLTEDMRDEAADVAKAIKNEIGYVRITDMTKEQVLERFEAIARRYEDDQ